MSEVATSRSVNSPMLSYFSWAERLGWVDETIPNRSVA